MQKNIILILLLVTFIGDNCTIKTEFIESKNKRDISELNNSYFFIPESINFDSLQTFHATGVFGFISKTSDLQSLNCIGYLHFFQKLKFKNVKNDSISFLLPRCWNFKRNLFLYTAMDGRNYFRARLDSLNGYYYTIDNLNIYERDTIALNYIKNNDNKTFNKNHIVSVLFYNLILLTD